MVRGQIQESVKLILRKDFGFNCMFAVLVMAD